MDIDGWLRGIGLEQYAEIFRANDIDMELLGRLTNDDLKDIGVVSFGHRKKLLEAIAELAGAFPVPPQPASRRAAQSAVTNLVRMIRRGPFDSESRAEMRDRLHVLTIRACRR